ncbi:uncharacterized protein METZ01_LOCUS99165 [marine metagenome]|uniref:Uncharacterized protein n=1 Tax=marine metagenome TaxID=408172 RepID=A0A381W1S0_9ZZZZ
MPLPVSIADYAITISKETREHLCLS